MRTTTWMIVLVLAGCGASAAPETAGVGSMERQAAGDEDAALAWAMSDDGTGEPVAETADGEPLPEAPWTADTVDAGDVPRELLAAWNGADNRDWCAPLAPSTATGARARRSSFDGGWAVEFDKRGLPGVTQSGRACTRCGRGAFGIAGTAMYVDDEDPTEAEEQVMRDGSRVRIEVSEDEEGEPSDANGVVATIKIRGQDCVYQVWSFGGDAHLQELLRDLRFVQTP